MKSTIPSQTEPSPSQNLDTQPNLQNISNRLQKRLLELPFDAFASLIARLLPKLYYQDVHLAGRRDFKGRNGRDGSGGFDLIATHEGRKVLIQLKQFDAGHPIFQRSLDELRGVALRSGAAEAVLITTSRFSPSVDRMENHLAPIARIITISGEDLIDLLQYHQVGVTQDGRLDEAFFASLEREAKGNRPSDCTGAASFVVTVDVRRGSKRGRARTVGLLTR